MADLNGLNTEMDAGNLFEEKIVSDRKIGTIRVMTPVKDDGTRDESRKMIFVGEAQIMTHMGASRSPLRRSPRLSRATVPPRRRGSKTL